MEYWSNGVLGGTSHHSITPPLQYSTSSMFIIFQVIFESIRQAYQQLVGHKLRTFLSLLGITIGIWCVISILSAISSLEFNIRNSLETLGDDVVYVSRFSWRENPRENWFKMLRRPNPDYDDFQDIVRRVKTYQSAAYGYSMGGRSIEYRSTDISRVGIVGVTYDYGKIFSFEFDKGRYFSRAEYNTGKNLVVLGAVTAEKLFGKNIDPIGKRVKISGRKFTVIGVLKKEGKDLINPMDFDEAAILPFGAAKFLANLIKGGTIVVKADENVSLDQLKDNITAVIRSSRRLRPAEEDNFSLNTLSIVTNVFDVIFGSMNMAGWMIGGFSLIVGMFSVANIMFVSVKERTSMIGVKKALGAKQYMILLEFLIESIILCSIGGAIGLAMVYGSAVLATNISGFEFFLSTQNMIVGTAVAIITGVLAGFIPALRASQLDPVVAMRQ